MILKQLNCKLKYIRNLIILAILCIRIVFIIFCTYLTHKFQFVVEIRNKYFNTTFQISMNINI